MFQEMSIRDSTSTVDILLKTNLALRPLPELEIEEEHHAQQNSSPDIKMCIRDRFIGS